MVAELWAGRSVRIAETLERTPHDRSRLHDVREDEVRALKHFKSFQASVSNGPETAIRAQTGDLSNTQNVNKTLEMYFPPYVNKS